MVITEKIQKILKRGYLKEKLIEEQFRNFESSLEILKSSLKNEETEEFNKNLVSEFLKSFKYETNTKGRVDLAIYKNEIPEVLVEFKSLKNIVEMPTKENFNKKAIHELVLYYLREKIKFKNLNVRNLIVTNGVEWFVIDAVEFEKIAKPFERLYIDFEIDKKLGITKNDDFYKIISQKIDLENLKVVHFSLNEEHDSKDLQNIYKLLSPEHLLKEFGREDANSLNRDFYLELLYILGLEETGGKKKLITRKKRQSRGSILEITILKLETEFKIFDKERLFEIALELNITWLNRILFLKLLEGRLVSIRDFPKFLTPETINNFGKLNTLFFEVLAFKEEERFSFKEIPYLNSSLFETTELERKYLRISNLNDDLEIKSFRGKEKIGTLKYLLNFLNSYNFGDDNSEFKKRDLINSAVLGLIFEKLNGYKDGSFFTPAFVTMYMTRETIQKRVVERFNSHFNWNCKNLEEIYNQNYKIPEANEILNSITIVDPAVGSGHFLVSALNELIYIKSKLGVLADENGKRLKNISVDIENDELYILDEDGEEFRYFVKNGKVADEVKRIQKTIFREKLQIIENQLFGVDINRNSVNIARLRLWTELLKESYYENEKLVTLPNIDINVKVGNSLISKYDLDTKLEIGNYKEIVNSYKSGKAQKKEIENLQNEFRSELRNLLSETLELKKLLKEYVSNYGIKELNKDLVWEVVQFMENLRGNELLKMFSEDEIEEKRKQDLKPILELQEKIEFIEHGEMYRNAFEWRFEFPESLNESGDFIGFDVVIGNPPYGIKPTKDEKTLFLEKYISAKTDKKFKGSVDSYSLFIERGLKISKGYVNFIVPLAVTSSDSVSQLHNLIYQNCEKMKVSSYSNRPTKVFDEADQRVAILEVQNNKKNTKEILTTTLNMRKAETEGKVMMKNLSFVESSQFRKYGRIPKVGEEIEIDILTKLFGLPKTLKDYYLENGEPVFYRTSGGRYFHVITNFSTGSSAENSIKVSLTYRDLVGAILSSSLYYWFYSVYSDHLNQKTSDLADFPVDLETFSENQISEISEIYKKYMVELQENSYVEGGFRRYIARKSKPLLDQIDLAIYKNFGLSSDEVNFLINFSKEFRV
ncbi:type I restriction enzyme R protein [Thiovulum sp. ES]|nr:type I restriction enzyme R protein [Thiovulum sp. ES]